MSPTPGKRVMDRTLWTALQRALGNDYEILRELTGAGMSRVFVAREIHLHRDVVVKVLPPDLAAGIKTERFEREIQFAARLQHPHIVPLLSAGSHEGLLYYTMPFVQGPSLSARLKEESAIPIVDAIAIMRDVADALSYAHSQGVVHRDVKPQNILLQSHHAVVVDFGVAKAVSDAAQDTTLTSTGIALGTPMYMAPEQALADPDVDERADIYSLGVVGYEMLTRRAPFKASSPQALMAAHVTSQPQPVDTVNSSVSPEVAAIVMRCLAKDPNERWETAEELCEALNDVGARFTPGRRAASNQPDHHKPIESEASGKREARLPRWTSQTTRMVGGLLGLLVIASGGYLYSGTRHEAAVAQQSLLVLPFTNAGGKEADFYVHGMTEEVITSLVKVDGLHVASPASSFAVAEESADPREAGQRVGARYVLLGDVRRAGNKLRITTRLLNVSNGQYTWSNSYDGRVDQVFDVQSDISSDIAENLTAKLVLRPGQKLPNKTRTDLTAYDLYLKGNYATVAEFSEATILKAIDYYQKALTIDPSYARAYSAIATAYYNLADDFWPPRKAYPLVQENALRALQLDSTLADAHASLASYEIAYGWNWDNAREHANRAVELNPNSPFARMMLAWYLVIAGKESAAVREAEAANALDPYSYETGSSSISLLRAAGRHDLAMIETRRLMSAGIGDTTVLRSFLAWDYMLTGRLKEAGFQVDSALAIDSVCCRRTRSLLYAHLGNRRKSIEMLNQFVAGKRSRGVYFRADWIAEVMAALDDREATFVSLDQALADRSLGLPLIPHNAELLRYRDDPRFVRIRNQLKLSP